MAWNSSWNDVWGEVTSENPLSWLNSTEQPPPLQHSVGAFTQFRTFLEFYMTPVVAAIGLIGNGLSLAVFMGSYLNRYSSSVYLAALAISDSLFLVCLLFSYSSEVGSDIYNTEGWCQALTYLTYITSFLSVWYVVAFSLERYIAVCYPLKRQEMCTSRRARIVVTSGAIFSLIFYSFSLFMMGLYPLGERVLCMGKPRYYYAINLLTNFDTALTFAIPVIIIIGCNLRITYMVFWFYREREIMVSRSQIRSSQRSRMTSGRSSMPKSSTRSPSSTASQLKVTKMLLIVSTVFLLCNLPMYTTKTYFTIRNYLNPAFRPSYTLSNLLRLFHFIYYSNFAMNFFLYNISGSTFRKALCRFMRKSCSRFRAFLCRRRSDEFNHSTSWNRKSRTLITERGPALITDNSRLDCHLEGEEEIPMGKVNANGTV